MSPSLSQAQAPALRSPEAAPRHRCGCAPKGTARVNGAGRDLSELVGSSAQKVDVLDTALNVAVIGGVGYLVYTLFFGD